MPGTDPARPVIHEREAIVFSDKKQFDHAEESQTEKVLCFLVQAAHESSGKFQNGNNGSASLTKIPGFRKGGARRRLNCCLGGRAVGDVDGWQLTRISR